MNNSPYLDRPLLSERERRLVDALRDLLEWEQRMGGFEAAAWERASALVIELDPS